MSPNVECVSVADPVSVVPPPAPPGIASRQHDTANKSSCPPSQTRCAYVTFLDGPNRGYIDGAFAIARALRLHGSKYPLVVAATPSVPADALNELALETNVSIRPIQLLELPESCAKDGTDVLLYQQFLSNFSKLRLWEFCDTWDKLVYLDSDVLPMQNIDDMFLAPHFSAAQDNMIPDPCVGPDECQAPGPLNKAPNRTSAAYFNAGVFVFEPSLEELADLMKSLEHYTMTRYAEQDFLNHYYRGRWNMLPMTYNWGRVSFFVLPELYNPATVKVIHFSGPAKPWRRTGDGKWPEIKDICEEESRLLRDPSSTFSKAVDKWWDAFRYSDDTATNPLRTDPGVKSATQAAPSPGDILPAATRQQLKRRGKGGLRSRRALAVAA